MKLGIALVFVVTIASHVGICASRRAYVAAAYDHARFGEMTDPPSLIVNTNLEKYKIAAEIAVSKKADIIVYPEYGVFYLGDRKSLKNFLEDIPDPKKIRTNPCEEKGAYSKRPILLTLSCIAKSNSLVVVANVGDIKNCSGIKDCPEDGVFQFNTNVVFDRDGTLLLRYYKEHLFFELGMDLPKEQQNTTFKTDFGTFATYICFDIMFHRMSQVAQWPQVDGVMFPTMWVDMTPQYVSDPLFQGWAMGNKATIVASNINLPGSAAVGSGIFHGRHGSLGYTFNTDGISKVVVARVPLDEEPSPTLESSTTAFTLDKIWDWKNDGENVPEVCSTNLFNGGKKTSNNYHCLEEDTSNYTLVKLTKPEGFVEVCNNGMCCSANYSAENMKETYYLAVSNDTFNGFNRYFFCEESCLLVRCDPKKDKPCGTFPRKSDTIFHHVELKSNFTTPFIYPSVVGSKVRLVPLDEWKFHVFNKSSFESTLRFDSLRGRNLINAGFKARCYQRDPPYIKTPAIDRQIKSPFY